MFQAYAATEKALTSIRRELPNLSSVTDRVYAAIADLGGLAEASLLVPSDTSGTLIPRDWRVRGPGEWEEDGDKRSAILILHMHSDGIAEWLAVLELLRKLLAMFNRRCGRGLTPAEAAIHLGPTSPILFRRTRLYFHIRRFWPGDYKKLARLAVTIEGELERINATIYSILLNEINLAV